jgi:hypothetical protein
VVQVAMALDYGRFLRLSAARQRATAILERVRGLPGNAATTSSAVHKR